MLAVASVLLASCLPLTTATTFYSVTGAGYTSFDGLYELQEETVSWGSAYYRRITDDSYFLYSTPETGSWAVGVDRGGGVESVEAFYRCREGKGGDSVPLAGWEFVWGEGDASEGKEVGEPRPGFRAIAVPVDVTRDTLFDREEETEDGIVCQAEFGKRLYISKRPADQDGKWCNRNKDCKSGLDEKCEPQEEEGCDGVQWSKEARNHVSFTSQMADDSGSVITKLWVKPTAFTCDYTMENLKTITFFVVNDEVDRLFVPTMLQKENRQNLANYFDQKSPNIKRPKKITVQTENNANKNITRNMVDNQHYGDNKQIERRLEETAYNVKTFELEQYRSFELTITAKDMKGRRSSITVSHNTFTWQCRNGTNATIYQTELCDGNQNCPNGEDEKPIVCQFSDLPIKLSYLCYLVMIIIIGSYYIWQKLVKSPSVIICVSISKQEDIKTPLIKSLTKEDFLSKYKLAHSDPLEMVAMVDKLKACYQKEEMDDKMIYVCHWIREVEEELHEEVAERYHCYLSQYGGSHPLTARILNPPGGLELRVRKRIDQHLAPRMAPWYVLNITGLFLMLCIHMFDYVKDIGEFFDHFRFNHF